MSRAHAYEDEVLETYNRRIYRMPRSQWGLLQMFPNGHKNDILVIHVEDGHEIPLLKDGIAARIYLGSMYGWYSKAGYIRISPEEKQKKLDGIVEWAEGKSHEEITDKVLSEKHRIRSTNKFRRKVFSS